MSFRAEHRYQTYEILHGLLTGLVYSFHKLQNMMRKTVYDGDTNVVIILVLQRSFAQRNEGVEKIVSCVRSKSSRPFGLIQLQGYWVNRT